MKQPHLPVGILRSGSCLPALIALRIPGYTLSIDQDDLVEAPALRACDEWFDAFCAEMCAASGRRNLPVMRMSDGEYLFLFGPQLDRRGFMLTALFRYLVRRFRWRWNGISAWTARGVSSGRYSFDERRSLLPTWERAALGIARNGKLAVHLTHGEVSFQQVFHPLLKSWLAEHSVTLDFNNYAPFYFVYAMLADPARLRALVSGRRVLVVNNATRDEWDAVDAHLIAAGAECVHKVGISGNRSAFDTISTDAKIESDIGFVGAGLGKPILMERLAAVRGPVIDAGYIIEVWKNPDCRWRRAFCVPDELLAANRPKVRFALPKNPL